MSKASTKQAKTLASLEAQAQDVRDSLAKALVKGDPCGQLREFLVELEAEIRVERARVAEENQRAAAEQAARAAVQKSAAVQKFEAEHPLAVALINEASERRRARVDAFRV